MIKYIVIQDKNLETVVIKIYSYDYKKQQVQKKT